MLEQESPTADLLLLRQGSSGLFNVSVLDGDDEIVDLSIDYSGFMIIRERVGGEALLSLINENFTFSDGSSGTNVAIDISEAQTKSILSGSSRLSPTRLIGDLIAYPDYTDPTYIKRLEFEFYHSTTDLDDYPPAP